MSVSKWTCLAGAAALILGSGASANTCEQGTLQDFYGAGGDICMNLSAGGAGGSYVGIFGEGFTTYMDDFGFGTYEVIYSAGSFENLVRIAKGESAFGLAQKDVQLYLEYKFDGVIPEGEIAVDDTSAPDDARSFDSPTSVWLRSSSMSAFMLPTTIANQLGLKKISNGFTQILTRDRISTLEQKDLALTTHGSS